MNLPKLIDFNFNTKNVLLRLDLDVEVESGKVADDTRLRESIPTISYLQKQGVNKITIIGHMGRPAGNFIESLSLIPVGNCLEKLLKEELGNTRAEALNIEIRENLRFDKREEASDLGFAKELVKNQDIFINESFGASHRDCASVTKIPKLLPHAAGLRLQEEIENLSKVLDKPKKPIVFILGGGKMDKITYVSKILEYADWVLVGGVLPQKINSYCNANGSMCVSAAHLTRDAKDITPDSARNFVEVIKNAGTIVWNGPMGDIDTGHWDSTKVIAEAVVDATAFKVAGGGDTLRMLQILGISSKIDYISTGGGAMLEFLAYGDLPGLRALRG